MLASAAAGGLFIKSAVDFAAVAAVACAELAPCPPLLLLPTGLRLSDETASGGPAAATLAAVADSAWWLVLGVIRGDPKSRSRALARALALPELTSYRGKEESVTDSSNRFVVGPSERGGVVSGCAVVAVIDRFAAVTLAAVLLPVDVVEDCARVLEFPRADGTS
jgi:hypothetical protein